MFNVALVVPTWHYFANPFKLQPIYELYFATVIDHYFEGKDIKVTVSDLRQSRLNGKNVNLDKVSSFVPERDLYIYWIMKTADYPEVLLVVKQLRQAYPESKHVAGGTHVDNFSQECRQYFDAVILGPGEESLKQIINDCRKNALKKVYQSDWDKCCYQSYPCTRRHYLPKESIVNTVLFEKYGGVIGTSFMFSRGCNFRCAYCVYNVPHKIQMRTPEQIEEEINYMKDEYAIKGVNLRDEICIPLAPKVAIPYLEAIGRCNVIWRGQTKVGSPKEVVHLARQAGCMELAVGVESASQQVLDIIRKGQTVKQSRDFIRVCKSEGIKIKMCLILGLPGEPTDIVELTRELIEQTQPDYVNISGFCPVPGSDIFQNKEYYGIKNIDKNWDRHAHLVFRFSDKESFGLPFEYQECSKWGKTFRREEIIGNIRELQQHLRERNMCY